MVENIMKSRN